MKVVLLGGLGLQGTAALLDLCRCEAVQRIVCADRTTAIPEKLEPYLDRRKIEMVSLDARDKGAIRELLKGGADVAIDLLPLPLMPNAFEAAIESAVSLVSTNYAYHLQHLDARAAESNISILPECGLDPGIDLVIYGEAVKHFDKLHRVDSYCGGLPERAACDNPLNYKVSWTWEGVLGTQWRDSVFIRNGRKIALPAAQQHSPDFVHEIAFEGLGTLEAIPNGNAVFYTDLLGVTGDIENTGRYALRWPGWSAFWRPLKAMGFLSEQPIEVEGCPVRPRKFLTELIGPQIQYREGEKDLVVMKNVFSGIKDGAPRSMVYDLVIERDLKTGLLAMSQGVGFPASIAAQMIGSGQIMKKGLLSPAADIAFKPFMEALAGRGITVKVHESSEP